MFLLGAGFALLMPIGLLVSPGDFWLTIANALAALVIGSIVAVVSWWIMCQQIRRLLAILKIDKCEEELPKGK